MADQTLKLTETVTYPNAPSVVIPAQSSHLRIRAEHGLLILLMTLIFLIRVTNIQYNTLFVDEAIYSNVGEETLQGVFVQAGTGWIFGSYLYPSTAAVANNLGGVIGLRLYSAVLVTIAAWFVYLSARRVFDRQTALWTLLLFGLTGVSISLGQFAVIDVMCVPLLAMALYYLLRGVQSEAKHQKLSFAVAGFAFALSVLSKYIALLCLPALVISIAWYCLMQGKSLRSVIFKLPWIYFIMPVVIILGTYGLLYFNDLRQVFSGAYSTQHEDRLKIIAETWEEIGAVAVLGIAGASVLAVQALNHYNARKLRNLLLAGVAVAIFAGAALSIPIYQTLTANVRSLWKHDVYCLIFLAPVAGYLITTFLDRFTVQRRNQMVLTRIVGAVVVGLGLYWFVNHNLDRNWGFQHSWPDATPAVNYMKDHGISEKSRVMASGSSIYEYYIHFGLVDRVIWQSTWYMEYTDAQQTHYTGVDAMKAAIHDCALDYAVMDDYYAPEMNAVLEPLLTQAGYRIGFKESQLLSFGAPIGVRVWIPPKAGECSGRTTL